MNQNNQGKIKAKQSKPKQAKPKQSKLPPQTDWDDIVASLQNWKRSFAAPAVTLVAKKYTRSPWSVLVSTIISLRTKDAVTLRASEQLLNRAPSPAALLSLTCDEIEKAIYPAGFYKTKAKNLKEMARIIMTEHNGNVPDNMEDLLALPGAGRKTANLVLIEAFDKDAICVDTHVHRICNRCAWLKTKTPDKTEFALREILPRKYWKILNELLVLYGQQLCKPVSPLCSKCVIAKHCAGINLKRRR